ncbi:hypothetical protein QJQ45_026389, partial [Haematococcus lacustris]
ISSKSSYRPSASTVTRVKESRTMRPNSKLASSALLLQASTQASICVTSRASTTSDGTTAPSSNPAAATPLIKVGDPCRCVLCRSLGLPPCWRSSGLRAKLVSVDKDIRAIQAILMLDAHSCWDKPVMAMCTSDSFFKTAKLMLVTKARPRKQAFGSDRYVLRKKRITDVYVNEPKRLKEGEEKHVISVFVADEAGIINRVAGVFARRAANIESLAVGLTRDKALFTIVVTGTANTIANLVKQVAKLIKVRYVEDITPVARIERELVLLKLSVPPGPERTEVLQLATIFRARVVDVAEATLTLCVSGDAGKCAAIQKVMTKFGIVEVARTGRVCLKRGEKLLEPVDYSRRSMDAMSPGPSAFTHEGREGDVYMVDDSDAPGVWEVENILESTYSSGDGSDYEAHTLSIEVKDVPGVLNMVTGVFARRGYNVQSLAVGPSEREGMSRICMVVPGAAPAIDKLVKQLNKLVDVQSVTNLTPMPFVNRELMLVKVRCGASQRGELRDLAAIFRADILDISPGTLTLEILGKEDKMKALTDLLEPYGESHSPYPPPPTAAADSAHITVPETADGTRLRDGPCTVCLVPAGIMEIARTGRVAVSRESGVDSKFLEQRQSQRIY